MTTTPVFRRRKRLLISGAALLGVVLLIALYPLVSYIKTLREQERELAEAIAEADTLDPGWRFDDLQAKRSKIPDAENGALKVQQAAAFLPWPWPARWNAPANETDEATPTLAEQLQQLSPEVALTEEQAQTLRDELDHVKDALKPARELVHLPHGRYQLNWPLDPSRQIDPFRRTRDVAFLLQMDAFLRAHEKDLDGALSDVIASLNTGRSIGDDLCDIALIHKAACERMAIASLERILAQGQASLASLKSVQSAFEDEATRPCLLVTLRNERALQYREFEAMADGRITLSDINGPAGPRPKYAWQAALEEHSFAKQMKLQRSSVLRVYTEAVEIAKLPDERQLKALSNLGAKFSLAELRKLKAKYGKAFVAPFGEIYLPLIEMAIKESLQQRALLRSASTALALERYRIAKGQWPDALPKLVEAGSLRGLPTDPYDAQPLRYRKLPDGVVIYSIGPDEVDNGGNLTRVYPPASATDLGVRLWNIEKRRQNPRQTRFSKPLSH